MRKSKPQWVALPALRWSSLSLIFLGKNQLQKHPMGIGTGGRAQESVWCSSSTPLHFQPNSLLPLERLPQPSKQQSVPSWQKNFFSLHIHVQPGYSGIPDKQHEHSQRQNPAMALACTHTFIIWCSACPRDQSDPRKVQKQGPKPSWLHRTRAELLL